jgi:hypothetical protein
LGIGDWGYKGKEVVFLAEYNTDDLDNPKERATLYSHYYIQKETGRRTQPYIYVIAIRRKSKIVFIERLHEQFDEALIQFCRIVRKRAEDMHPLARYTLMNLYGGYAEIPKESTQI